MENKKELKDGALKTVNAGSKTEISVDDTIIPSGFKIEIEGEMVTLIDDGNNGFTCTVNGKEYRFTYEEVAEMIRKQMRE